MRVSDCLYTRDLLLCVLGWFNYNSELGRDIIIAYRCEGQVNFIIIY